MIVHAASLILALALQADRPLVSPAPTAGGPGLSGDLAGTERWIVTFASRSFDLSAFDAAVRGEAPAGAGAAILRDLAAAARADQAGFARAVAGFGGRVREHWWLIAACSIEVPAARVRDVARLPGVLRVDLDAVCAPGLQGPQIVATRTNSARSAISPPPCYSPRPSGPGSPRQYHRQRPSLASRSDASTLWVAAAGCDGLQGPRILAGCDAWIRTATNAQNHGTDLVQAAGVRGAGVSIAIMDTGQDETDALLGRPHQTYYLDGDINTAFPGGIGGSRLLRNVRLGAMPADDTNGHGTAVAGVAAGGKWNIRSDSDHGHAPHAGILGYAIADDAAGLASFETVITAWQSIAADKLSFGTVAANNSYEGSPDPTHPQQQALDAAAFHANLLVTVSAGNTGISLPSGSQSCANGLAVGAVHADTRALALFSAQGPLPGDRFRTYPDVVANGVGVVMPQRDRALSSFVADGTSFAAPQVAGAAALYVSRRGATVPMLETKAAILATLDDVSAENPNGDRNDFGLGYLRVDRLVAAAGQAQLRVNSLAHGASLTFFAPVKAGRRYVATLVWPRRRFDSRAWSNLDLRVRHGQFEASSNSLRNLYERVDFTPLTTGSATLIVENLFQDEPALPFALLVVEAPVHGAASGGLAAGGDGNAGGPCTARGHSVPFRAVFDARPEPGAMAVCWRAENGPALACAAWLIGPAAPPLRLPDACASLQVAPAWIFVGQTDATGAMSLGPVRVTTPALGATPTMYAQAIALVQDRAGLSLLMTPIVPSVIR